MLSELSQTEKGKYCVTSLICGIFKKTNIKEIGFVITRGGCRNWMKVVKSYGLAIIK